MKDLIIIIVIGAGLCALTPISAETVTISTHSLLRGKSLETRLNEDMLKKDHPSGLYKNQEGRLVWAVTATVTLDEARDVAIAEAKRLVGADYDKNWVITQASRMVSGSNRVGKNLHHYRFSFKENNDSGYDNLNIIVLLDGTLLPVKQR